MSRFSGSLCLFLWIVWPLSPAYADAYLTVDDYRQLDASQQRAWIAGIVDGLLLASKGGSFSGRRWLLDCIREQSMDQLHQAFAEYIDANPDYLQYAAAGEFAMAMNESCPKTPFW